MRAVNLLPEDTSSRKIANPGALPIAGAAATLVAVGAVFALAHSESGTVATRQARVDELKQQLASVPTPRTAGSTAGAAILGSRDSRTAAVQAALKSRVPWDVLLRQVAQILPDGTWLDGMQLAAPVTGATAAAAAADPTAPATSGITITGYTTDAAQVAIIMQRLAALPSLADIKLQPSAKARIGDKSYFKFGIGANVATGGPS
jgi:Tfp pilus assembly protein PilN